MDNETQSRVNVVSIGGGTGLSRLLLGLKQHVASPNLRKSAFQPFSTIRDLTAVVTVTDDGGSSGRLREEFQMLPPGDIRKCLVALSEDEFLMSKLFRYRFASGGELQGHSFGNLFLTALTSVTGDFLEAIRLCSEVLAIRGKILPSTMADVHLVGELENGVSLLGESLIGRSSDRIRRISIFPDTCDPLPETLEAIKDADIVTVGPGSLFTSLLPNLLINGIPQAMNASPALKVYIGNIMTQKGETLGFTASDHLKSIHEHCTDLRFDYALWNLTQISPSQRKNYLEENATQIENDVENMKPHAGRVILRDLLAEGDKVRHDPLKLSQAVLEILLSEQKQRLSDHTSSSWAGHR